MARTADSRLAQQRSDLEAQERAVAVRRTELEAEELEEKFKGSARWREIVDTAADLFSRQGYDATSMQEIADAVGMLKGSVYHYIRTKEDLLFQVLLEVHSVDYAAGIDAGLPSIERVRTYVQNHLRYNLTHLSRVSLYAISINALSPARQEVVIARRRRYDETLRSFIADGKNDGTVRVNTDEKLTAIAMLTAMNSVHAWYDPSRGHNVEAITDAFTELFITGLRS